MAKWADIARKATVKRDIAIRMMHTQGASFRTIARAAGLSVGAIQKIVRKGQS